jgi:aldehyde:ferredoxin oxidoreductase
LQQVHEASGVLLMWLGDLNNIMEGAHLSPEVMRDIAVRYWGSAAAADYSSYEGKALAAKRIQDRTYAIESLILCSGPWPMIRKMIDTDGDAFALPSQIFSAVTGRELDEGELDKMGERIFNLQRAILLRQGWGGRSGDRLLDYHHEEPIQYLRFNRKCEVPGRNGEIKSRKGAVIDREEFEKMKNEYYELRGWDVESGLQTRAKLKELQLEDIAGDMDKRGLLK